MEVSTVSDLFIVSLSSYKTKYHQDKNADGFGMLITMLYFMMFCKFGVQFIAFSENTCTHSHLGPLGYHFVQRTKYQIFLPQPGFRAF